MKKAIITGYFIGVMLLTYFTAKAISVYRIDDSEITFLKVERKLSDKEMIEHGIEYKDDKHVREECVYKETRTRKGLGWETKTEIHRGPEYYYY